MPKYRVIVASNNSDFANKIKNLLTMHGFQVMDCCKTGNEAIKKSHEYYPDAVIIHDKLTDMAGIQVSSIISEQFPIILLTHMSSLDHIDDFENIYAVSLPARPDILINTINLAIRFGIQLSNIKKKTENDRSEYEKQMINKAKEFLQTNFDFTEQKAHRTIQKLSMDRRIKMAEAAKLILQEGNLMFI